MKRKAITFKELLFRDFAEDTFENVIILKGASPVLGMV